MALTLEPAAAAGRTDAHAHEALAAGGRYESIVDAIGHTPLVAIPRLSPNPRACDLYAKLEMPQPDRARSRTASPRRSSRTSRRRGRL